MEAKRTGRPPMPEHLRRSLDVSVRVTRAEHANLRELAERAGVDVSEFVRRRVLGPQRGGAYCGEPLRLRGGRYSALRLRVTETEHEDLGELAQRAGLGLSQFVRARALGE